MTGENSVKRILVAISSKAENSGRRAAIRTTWAANPPPCCQVVFFTDQSEAAADEPGLERLPVAALMPNCSRFALALFRQVMNNHDFDWIFRCEDNHYVCLNRLSEILDDEYHVIGNELTGVGGTPSASAGYMISRSAVEEVVAMGELGMQDDSEDGILSVLTERGINFKASGHLRWNLAQVPTSDNQVVSCHWCSPERMQMIDDLVHNRIAPCCYCAIHPHWVDNVMFYQDGTFLRQTSGCRGKWIERDGEMTLKWDKWGETKVRRFEDGYANDRLVLFDLNTLADEATVPVFGEMKIDLADYPVLVTSGWRFEKRRIEITRVLAELGLDNPTFFNSELASKPGRSWGSITFNHLAAIASRPPPFILLEDDARPTNWFKRSFSVSAGADAVWLGLTEYGMIEGRTSSNGARFWGDPAIPRLSNMLGTHAILFLSDRFVNVFRGLLLALLRLNPNTPHDRMAAMAQAGWNVYGVNPPLFFQDDGHYPCVTNQEIRLPQI